MLKIEGLIDTVILEPLAARNRTSVLIRDGMDARAISGPVLGWSR